MAQFSTAINTRRLTATQIRFKKISQPDEETTKKKKPETLFKPISSAPSLKQYELSMMSSEPKASRSRCISYLLMASLLMGRRTVKI
jgi:hypothetical protein